MIERFIDWAVRLICLTSLCWIALIVGQQFGSDPPPTATTRSANQNFELPAGHWTFRDSALAFKTTTCSDSELESYFLEFDASADRSTKPNFDPSELIRLAKSSGAKETRSELGNTWRLDGNNLRLRLRVSSDESSLDDLVLAAKETDHWELFSLASERHLPSAILPMGADSSVTCSRMAAGDSPVMQLVSTSDSNRAITSRWKQHGWAIEQTPWGNGSRLSVFCTNGDLSFYAW